MNFNLNIHRVKAVRLSPIRVQKAAGDRSYSCRDITIETDEGSFELTLFSQYAGQEDEVSDLLEVKV